MIILLKRLSWISHDKSFKFEMKYESVNDDCSIQIYASQRTTDLFNQTWCFSDLLIDFEYYKSELLSVAKLQSTSFSRNVDLLMNWLRSCIVEHDKCKTLFSEECLLDADENVSLSTHVIDVNESDNEDAQIKILMTKSCNEWYLALSHQWEQLQLTESERRRAWVIFLKLIHWIKRMSCCLLTEVREEERRTMKRES